MIFRFFALLLFAGIVFANEEFAVANCIRFSTDLDLVVEYKIEGEKTREKVLKLPKEATVEEAESKCGEESQVLALSWNTKPVSNESNLLTFHFVPQNEGGFRLDQISLDLILDNETFPGHSEAHFSSYGNVLNNSIGASEGKFYSCNSPKDIQVVENELTLKLENAKVQAYSNSTEWVEKSETCPEDEKTTTINPKTTVGPAVEDKWSVKNENGTSCIIFKGNVTLTIKYHMIDNSTSKFVSVEIPSSSDAQVSGSCNIEHKNMTSQEMEVKFVPVLANETVTEGKEPWTITFWFTKDEKYGKDKQFTLYEIELDAVYKGYEKLFPNASDSKQTFIATDKEIKEQISPSQGNSASCSQLTLDMEEDAKIELKAYHLQAFSEKDTFSKAQLCARDQRTNDIVPIVVGACLAGLVIVVLVAYLIGRARAKRQGYASV